MPEQNRAPVMPVFARPVDRKESTLMDRDAYGEYLLALKHWRFDPGQRNNPSWRAHVVVIESTNPNYPPGRETQLHFPVGRPGTASDPGRPDRDENRIHTLMQVIAKKLERGWDSGPMQRKLHEKGKLPDDSLRFRLKREQGNTVKRYDNKADKVIEVMYEKDRFSVA